MPRTIVYPKAAVKRRAPGRDPNPDEVEATDRYRDKVVKYIPAEAVAFFSLAAVTMNKHWPNPWRWTVLVMGTIIAMLYPVAADRTAPTVAWYSYLLTAAAFVAWALGTSSLGSQLFPSWPHGANKVIMAAAIPLIPAVDDLLTRRRLARAG